MIQTRLPIFDDTTFGELLLAMELPNYDVVPHKRLKRSWRLERKGKQVTLSVPHHFSDAPIETKKDLLLWAQMVEQNKFSRRGIGKELKSLEKDIYTFLYESKQISQHRYIPHPDKRFKTTAGVLYDLQPVFDELNTTWFDGELISWLRWGRNTSGTSYHTKISDKDGGIHDLITIAGVYNRPTVPLYALQSVLYHEMLHIACPPIEKDGVRRHVHHKEFREREQAFPSYAQWQAWLTKGTKKRGWFR